MTAFGHLNRLLTALCLVVLTAYHANAASLVVTGDGTSYSVNGIGMDGVNGIDITLGYDSSSLSSPSVSQGNLVSGAMMVANTTGSIRIAIISASKTFSGGGQVAAIKFASSKGSGGISSCQVNSVVDSYGKSLSVPCTVAGGSGSQGSSTPGIPFSQPATAAPAATTPSTSLGTVSMPGDTQAKSETKPQDTSAPAAQPSEQPAPAANEAPVENKQIPPAQKPKEMKTISHKGALENFRSYRGEKSPAIFVALMTREVTPTIRQEPIVALSDGKTTVKIQVKLSAADNESPNFALNGAKMMSLGKDDAAAAWIIEALPQMNTFQATLTILTSSEIIDFPLTVAPPVAGVSPAEADFASFLKDSGAVPPKRDLNADGRHDYLDDFIYTANYLNLKGATGKAR